MTAQPPSAEWNKLAGTLASTKRALSAAAQATASGGAMRSSRRTVMTEQPPTHESSGRARFKVMLTVAMLAAAGAVTYHQLADDENAAEQLATAVGDATYDVRCSGCNESFTMSAAEYIPLAAAASGDAGGIVCPKCGAGKAWRAESFTIPDQKTGESEADYEKRTWGSLGRSRLKPGVTLDPPTGSETPGESGG